MTMTRRRKALIIENHPETACIIAEILNRRGFHVATHITRESAALILKDFQPDVILMEYLMPGLSAEDFLKRCKHECPRAKIALVSDTVEAERVAKSI